MAGDPCRREVAPRGPGAPRPPGNTLRTPANGGPWLPGDAEDHEGVVRIQLGRLPVRIDEELVGDHLDPPLAGPRLLNEYVLHRVEPVRRAAGGGGWESIPLLQRLRVRP